MKTRLEKCNVCNEETRHDVRKKQGTNSRGAYLRRNVKRCRTCGTIEIMNQKRGRRIVAGKNLDVNQVESE